MSIMVAADIKNCPNADNMNPINWTSRAAILLVLLNQCRRVVKRLQLTVTEASDKEKLSSDVDLHACLCLSVGGIVGNKMERVWFHLDEPIIQRKRRTEAVW